MVLAGWRFILKFEPCFIEESGGRVGNQGWTGRIRGISMAVECYFNLIERAEKFQVNWRNPGPAGRLGGG